MKLSNQGRYRIEILTLCGKIEYWRTQLIPADKESAEKLLELEGIKSIYPLDCALNIDRLPFKITIDAMIAIAREAVKAKSYEEAAREFEHHYKVPISSTQVKRVTEYIGGIVQEINAKAAEDAMKAQAQSFDRRTRRRRANDVLYIEIDGAMVNTRIMQGGSTWMECKLAVAFHSRDIHYWTSKSGKKCHKILKRDYAGFIGSNSDFEPYLAALADRYDAIHCSEVVVISDGAPWIAGTVGRLLPDHTVHILDLFHVKEKVGDFAKYIFKNKENEYTPWAEKINDLIEDGKVDEVIREVEKYKDQKFPPGVPNLYVYLVNHRGQMNYPLYRSKGYFVGSGAIESANKQVMQSRLKLQGMRWYVSSAQCMLALKMMLESERWGEVEGMVRRYIHPEDAPAEAKKSP